MTTPTTPEAGCSRPAISEKVATGSIAEAEAREVLRRVAGLPDDGFAHNVSEEDAIRAMLAFRPTTGAAAMREAAAGVAMNVKFGVRPSSMAEAEGRSEARALIAQAIKALPVKTASSAGEVEHG